MGKRKEMCVDLNDASESYCFDKEIERLRWAHSGEH